MHNLKFKELNQARQLIRGGKLEKALQLISEFGKEKALSLNEQVLYYILKSTVSLYQFKDAEILKYAEEAYKQSQNLTVSLQLVDVYIQMAMGLMYRFKSEEPFELLVKAEKLLRILTEESPTELLERQATMAYIRAWLYDDQNEKEKALEYAQRGLEMRERIDHKVDIGISLLQIGWIYFMIDNDLALKYVDQCIEYCEKINYKNCIQKCNMLKGLIYLWKGEINPALEYFKLSKTLLDELSKETKNEFGTAQLYHLIGMVYQEKNKLNRAKEYFEKALVIKEKVGAYFSEVMTLDELISLALYKKDLEDAEKYIEEMKRISNQEDNKFLKLCYRVNMAKLLKLSLLPNNRAKAEEILKECLEDKVATSEAKIIILLNLSDLLLAKLGETNDLKLLDEIKVYITQVYDIAKNQKSYFFLAETYLLRAKLELLTLNLKESQRFLDKAHNITEIYGLVHLNQKILKERNELIKQTDNWDELRRTKASMAEIIKLSHVEEQLTRILRKRFLLKTP